MKIGDRIYDVRRQFVGNLCEVAGDPISSIHAIRKFMSLIVTFRCHRKTISKLSVLLFHLMKTGWERIRLKMVHLEEFEPPTPGFEFRYSILLNYGCCGYDISLDRLSP